MLISLRCDVAGSSWPASTLVWRGSPIGVSAVMSMITTSHKMATSRE